MASPAMAQGAPVSAAADSTVTPPQPAEPAAGAATTPSAAGLTAFPAAGRYGQTAILDPSRDRMVVFGGSDASPRNDLWALSLSGSPAWSALTATGSAPPARTGHAAVYDPVRDRMVVFGGTDGTPRDDVWALSLSGGPAWSPLSPAGGTPPARSACSAIYDPVRDRVVVFGGMDGYSSRNDVWALSLSGSPTWSALTPAGGAPSPRYGHTAVYDSVGDRMLVFGGYDPATGSRKDVWALSLSGSPAWSAVATSGRSPGARHGHTAICDATHGRMVVFGGTDGYGSRHDVWALSLSDPLTWTALAATGSQPFARQSHTAIDDPAGDRMLVFGGSDAGTRNDVWALALGGSPAWSGVSPTVAPPAVRAPRPFLIGFGGGALVPIGDFSKSYRFNAKAGLELTGSVDYMILDWLAIGVDGSTNHNRRATEGEIVDPPSGTDILTKDRFTTTQIGVHASYYRTSDSPMNLWLLLGVGGYSFTEKFKVTFADGELADDDQGKSKTGMRPGAKVGIGIGFRMTHRLSLVVAGDFNYVSLDNKKMNANFDENLSSLEYVGIHAGVTYHVGAN